MSIERIGYCKKIFRIFFSMVLGYSIYHYWMEKFGEKMLLKILKKVCRYFERLKTYWCCNVIMSTEEAVEAFLL